MHILMTVNFKDMIRSIDVESSAREFGLNLARCAERLSGCHFTFERHTTAGSSVPLRNAPVYKVTIRLSLPWAQIHADNILRDGAGHGDLHGALREAYDNARRQLADCKRPTGVPAVRPSASTS